MQQLFPLQATKQNKNVEIRFIWIAGLCLAQDFKKYWHVKLIFMNGFKQLSVF